jgi:hypothetical protein
MEKINDIKRLIERFLEGDTSLQEEKTLYDYFRNAEVGPELLEYKEMFLAFDQMQFDVTESASDATIAFEEGARNRPHAVEIKPKTRFLNIRHMVAVAAVSVVVLLLAGKFALSGNDAEYCEAYIYGKRVTNEQVVMHEMTSTLKSVDAGSETVDSQLKDAFSSMN